MTKKEYLFSVTKNDFVVRACAAGGRGGQHQNTTASAIQIDHPPSGARGECRNHRSQHRNKKEAFQRLVNSDKFQEWLKLESAKYNESLRRRVDEQMRPENITVEYCPFEEG